MSIEYQIGVLIILSLMALIALINVLTIRSLGPRAKPRTFPMVSVLIPARNEEENIGKCLASLADQDYPDYEILVLDDGSEDRTAAIVREWELRSGRIRYLKGNPLPPGWVGKSFACHQLSRAARGDLLLFVDADTVHSRNSIATAVAELEYSAANLLTVIPRQTMETFWEKTVLPLLHFSTFCYLPLPLVTMARNPRFAMANGQYMLFRRAAYETIGGHQAVREAMVEDVWLSRLIKKHGLALRIMEGGPIVSCRMYSSLKNLWLGFSKNLFAGFRFSLPAVFTVALLNALTSVAPFFFLSAILLGQLPEGLLPVITGQVALLLGIRTMLSARFRLSYLFSLLHPLAVILAIGMGVNSVRWILAAGGARWKGRQYRFRNQILEATRNSP